MIPERRHRFQNILFVALDVGTEPPSALDNAIRLAEVHEAKLTLYDVVPSVPLLRRELDPDGQRATLNDLAVAAIESELGRWLDPYGQRIDAAIAVDIGRRPIEVVARVRRDHHDLVIVAPDHSPDSLATVRRVMRVCPCPVLVLRTRLEDGSTIAAVDPDDRIELNAMILHVAESNAARLGTNLVAAHAYEQYGASLIADDELTQFADRIHAAHKNAMSDLLDHVGAHPSVGSRIIHGTPAQALTALVDDIGAALIVVGSAGRRNMSVVLTGNTADRLVESTSASLLLVKPAGFDPEIIEQPDAADIGVAAARASTT